MKFIKKGFEKCYLLAFFESLNFKKHDNEKKKLL